VVVKLGGSLLEAEPGTVPPVMTWLEMIAKASRAVVLVPGGGAFADAVRREQARLGLSDTLAHRMALFAMHQGALALVGLAPPGARLVAAASRAAIADAHAKRRTPVWQPLPMVDRDGALPEDWTVTSDGLAAWLAREIQASAVVLVKSCRVPQGADVHALADSRVVDPVFADIVSASGLRWLVAGPGDEAKVAEAVGIDGAAAAVH